MLFFLSFVSISQKDDSLFSPSHSSSTSWFQQPSHEWLFAQVLFGLISLWFCLENCYLRGGKTSLSPWIARNTSIAKDLVGHWVAPVLFHPLSGRMFNGKALHETLGNSTTTSLITYTPTRIQYSLSTLMYVGGLSAMQYGCRVALLRSSEECGGVGAWMPSSGGSWIHSCWLNVSMEREWDTMMRCGGPGQRRAWGP